MYGQFEPLQGALAEMKITMNVCSEAEHIGDINRLNCMVKERACGVVTHLPIKKLPGRMVIEMVHLCAFWINMFPPGLKTIYPTMSPRDILTSLNVDFNNHCKLEFGEYDHTHKEHDNTMASRTCAAISLRPTGNAQGGYYFMSLRTVARITEISGPLSRYPALSNSRSNNSQRTTPRDWIFATATDARLLWMTTRDTFPTKIKPTMCQTIMITQMNCSSMMKM